MENIQHQYEELKKDQMKVYADLLRAYRTSVELSNDILEALTLADFSNHQFVKSLNEAINDHAIGTNKLATAFTFYAESHGIDLSD